MARRMRREREPRYTVHVGLKAYDLSKAGTAITLTVRADSHPQKTVLGTIEIGQGTFGWRSSNAKRFKRLDWNSFAKQMAKIS